MISLVFLKTVRVLETRKERYCWRRESRETEGALPYTRHRASVSLYVLKDVFKLLLTNQSLAPMKNCTPLDSCPLNLWDAYPAWWRLKPAVVS